MLKHWLKAVNAEMIVVKTHYLKKKRKKEVEDSVQGKFG